MPTKSRHPNPAIPQTLRCAPMDGEAFESAVLMRYLHNLLGGAHLPPSAVQAIHTWLDEESVNLGLEEIEGWSGLMVSLFEARPSRNELLLAIKKMKEKILPFLEDRLRQVGRLKPSVLENNISVLAEAFGLDCTDREILGLSIRYKAVPAVENLCDALNRALPPQRYVSLLLGVRHTVLLKKLEPASRLLETGLVKRNRSWGRNNLECFAEVSDNLVSAVQNSLGGIEEIQRFLLGKPQEPELTWEDFSHLGRAAENLALFIEKVQKGKVPGANILIYGPPGTGKTEFAKVLAKRVRASLYMVAETGADGEEPSRNERISTFLLAQTFLRGRGKSIILFDEMEDIFQERMPDIDGRGRSAGSKVYLNRLLEQNRVPVIWIINNPSRLEESFVRRMAYALEMRVPGAGIRKSILCRILDRHGVTLGDGDIADLLRYDDFAPGVVDSAVRMVRLTGGSSEDIQAAARSVIRAMNGGLEKQPRPDSAERFEPTLINADLDVTSLADRLTAAGKGSSFSLCLYGPPGTGKTAFVRHLADRMGMELVVRRASDLLGMFVGQTEAAIAGAFRDAREEGKFLVFDEADSFLGDRRGAQRNWEVSMVNEMLTWMECHPFPFACTTNLMEHLDEASLRRFTFKIRFDFLRPEQAAQAFYHFFGAEAPAGLWDMKNLTPGDLAVVRKKANVLNFLDNPREIVNFLMAEVNMKKAALHIRGFGG